MKIFFVRHGSDYGDLLSDYGVEQMKKAAKFLKALNLDISEVCILTSPKKRATNSAKIIRQTLELPKIRKVDWLDDYNDGNDVTNALANFFSDTPKCQVVIAVSHAPVIRSALLKISMRTVGKYFYPVNNGSIHMADIEAGTTQRLFEP